MRGKLIGILVAARRAFDLGVDLAASLLAPVEPVDAGLDRCPGQERNQPTRRDAGPSGARLGGVGELPGSGLAQCSTDGWLVCQGYSRIYDSDGRCFDVDTPGSAGGSAVRSARRLCAWVTWLPGGTPWVSQTLPPMIEPRPMVTRPSTVAPA